MSLRTFLLTITRNILLPFLQTSALLYYLPRVFCFFISITRVQPQPSVPQESLIPSVPLVFNFFCPYSLLLFYSSLISRTFSLSPSPPLSAIFLSLASRSFRGKKAALVTGRKKKIACNLWQPRQAAHSGFPESCHKLQTILSYPLTTLTRIVYLSTCHSADRSTYLPSYLFRS